MTNQSVIFNFSVPRGPVICSGGPVHSLVSDILVSHTVRSRPMGGLAVVSLWVPQGYGQKKTDSSNIP